MRTTRRLCVAAVLGASLFLVVAPAGPALAHEEKTVGRYHLAVGFGDEPAYASSENSVQMFLHDARDNPVVDLGPTLQVVVSYGGQTMPPITMEPDFEVGESGTPGDYRAFFFPTRPGTYSFHLTGSIKGQAVDATFTSGPSTFSDVIDPATVEFPVKDPTTGEVAQRLQRQIPRQDAAIAQARSDATDAAHRARLVAVIALAVGAVGVVLGAIALVTVRRRVGTFAATAGPDLTADREGLDPSG